MPHDLHLDRIPGSSVSIVTQARLKMQEDLERGSSPAVAGWRRAEDLRSSPIGNIFEECITLAEVGLLQIATGGGLFRVGESFELDTLAPALAEHLVEQVYVQSQALDRLIHDGFATIEVGLAATVFRLTNRGARYVFWQAVEENSENTDAIMASINKLKAKDRALQDAFDELHHFFDGDRIDALTTVPSRMAVAITRYVNYVDGRSSLAEALTKQVHTLQAELQKIHTEGDMDMRRLKLLDEAKTVALAMITESEARIEALNRQRALNYGSKFTDFLIAVEAARLDAATRIHDNLPMWPRDQQEETDGEG